MKKFLPFILFVFVFSATVVGNILYKKMGGTIGIAQSSEEYAEYESLFLHAKYTALDGSVVEMSKLSAPVIIYNFWASWCTPCLEEMPSMVNLKQKFTEDQLQIVAINTDEEDQLINIKKTIEKLNLGNNFLMIPDIESKLVNDFKVAAIPVTIIFNRGKVVHFSNGPMDFNSEEIVGKIKEWVEK